MTTTASNDLKTQEVVLGAALTRYEAERAKLLDETGKRIFSDEQHAKREQQLSAPVVLAAERAEEVARAALADAEREETTAAADPAAGLDRATLDRANSLFTFISRDVDTLPLASLAERVRAVLAGDDRALQFTYLRALPARLDATTREIERGRLNPPERAGWRELRLAVEELERRMTDAGGKRAAAAAKRTAANELLIRARKSRMAADGSLSQRAAQMDRLTRAMF